MVAWEAPQCLQSKGSLASRDALTSHPEWVSGVVGARSPSVLCREGPFRSFPAADCVPHCPAPASPPAALACAASAPLPTPRPLPRRPSPAPRPHPNSAGLRCPLPPWPRPCPLACAVLSGLSVGLAWAVLIHIRPSQRRAFSGSCPRHSQLSTPVPLPRAGLGDWALSGTGTPVTRLTGRASPRSQGFGPRPRTGAIFMNEVSEIGTCQHRDGGKAVGLG